MPPKKQKTAKKPALSSDSSPNLAPPSTIDGRRVQNSSQLRNSGLLAMPVELLNEIVSYFPDVILPTSGNRIPLQSPTALERIAVLRALSQSCLFLRFIFFPLLWKHVEVSSVRCGFVPKPTTWNPTGQFSRIDLPSSWFAKVGEALERKSLGLSRNSVQAASVRSMSVSLTRYSTGTILPAFVACLEVLPNLHTLQIFHAHTQMTTALKEASTGHTFPSIQVIILPGYAHELLRCCPNVKSVVANSNDDSKLVTAIAKGCKLVESLEGFGPDENMMKRIIKAVPNLRVMKFKSSAGLENLQILAALKNVYEIRLPAPEENRDASFANPEFRKSLQAAREIVEKSPDPRRALSVRYSRYSPADLLSEWTEYIELPRIKLPMSS